MSVTVYVVSAMLVFVFSGLLAMAGVGAAFLFVPLAEAAPTALLLNVVSLLFATINYWRGKLINWRVGLPVLIAAVILSPLGARLTPLVDKKLLLGMFAAFLVFAGFMMLLYKAKKREQPLSRAVEVGAGAGGLDPLFIGIMSVMAAAGSIVGSQLMKTKLSSAQLKKIIGVLLWLIAAKMILDLVR